MRPLTLSSTRSQSETKKEPEVELTENEKKFTVQIEELTKEVTEHKEKSVELLDKYKRALADGENLRQRLTKQIDDAKQFGIQGFCKDLLEVADVLGHATEAVPVSEVSDKNPHLKGLFEGLKMTKGTLEQIFKRHGLEQVNPINEKFNPNYHEALFQIVSYRVWSKWCNQVYSLFCSIPGKQISGRQHSPAGEQDRLQAQGPLLTTCPGRSVEMMWIGDCVALFG